MEFKFPKEFWWGGTASSGPQSEGVYEGDNKGESIWDYWYEKNQKNSLIK